MRGALIALALLTGCQQPNVGKDGYEFMRAEFFRPNTQETTIRYPSLIALRAAAKRLNAKVEDERDLQAFATYSPTKPTCTIHIIDPAVAYRPEWIGHEKTHCVFGNWH